MARAAALGCSMEEIASLLGITRNAFYKRIETDPTILERLDIARNGGKQTLRRFQWQRAKAGSDTMLIWLGKQMLKQRDKFQHVGGDPEDGDKPIEMIYRWQDEKDESG